MSPIAHRALDHWYPTASPPDQHEPYGSVFWSHVTTEQLTNAFQVQSPRLQNGVSLDIT